MFNFYSNYGCVWHILLVLILVINQGVAFRKYSAEDVTRLREEVREMFQHAYEGYLTYASDYDELRPLSCDGINTWGSYSLTLIDALDTLAVLGNYSEFRRVVNLLSEKISFDSNINVSVFETNIRIVGGLLSAHLMSQKAGYPLEPGWPCNGPLLRLAEDVAKRLLPAFDTKTGMPYGTVNLKYGVPAGETTVTCTAGVGTFIVEFGALSRLTGDPIYEEVALNALYALWKYKSPIGLFGNHIDVQTGRWTAQDAGIGAGIDSFYEYLVKGALMLNRPELLEMFHIGRAAIDKYLKRDDWHVWVSMNKGQVTLPVFQSLEAYWPGVLSMIGDIGPAMRTLHNYHSVWKQYGFLPEFYNIPSGEAGANRENYPLRPELIESAMYLYRATGDPFLLELGEDMLRSIQYSAKTSCGYATIRNVRDHRKEDRMESFFLAETTKYLYLLFDPDNFLNNKGNKGTVHETPNGICIIDAGGYIFNTEAHPIDPSALRCCHDLPRQDLFKDFRLEKFIGDHLERNNRNDDKYVCPQTTETPESTEKRESRLSNFTVDINAPDDPYHDKHEFFAEIMNNIKESQIKKAEAETAREKLARDEGSQSTVVEPKAESIDVASKRNESVVDMLDMESFSKQIDSYNEFINGKLIEDGDGENLISEKTKKIHDFIDGKVSNLLTVLEVVVEVYLKELTAAANSTNNDNAANVTLSIDDIPESSLVNSMMANYAKYAKTQLTLRSYADLQALQKKQKISKFLSKHNEDIRVTARKILLLLKIGVSQESLQLSHPDIIEIFIKAQEGYEKYMANKTISGAVFSFVSQIKDEDLLKKSNMLKILSIIQQAKERTALLKYQETKVKKIDSDLFSTLMDILTLKERFISKKVKNLGSTNEKLTKSNDDIILVENFAPKQDIPSEDSENIGEGTVEEVTDHPDLKESTTEDERLKQDASTLPSYVDNTSNNSVLTDIVQSILKSTIPAKPKFDPQLLLERIRAEGVYNNQTQNFELLSCRAQPYFQRIAINGEIF